MRLIMSFAELTEPINADDTDVKRTQQIFGTYCLSTLILLLLLV